MNSSFLQKYISCFHIFWPKLIIFKNHSDVDCPWNIPEPEVKIKEEIIENDNIIEPPILQNFPEELKSEVNTDIISDGHEKENKKKLVCPNNCGRKFEKSGNLKKHVNLFCGKKIYQCEACVRTFC